MNDQLTELLTDYGKIRAVWFDGKWDQAGNPDFNWQFEEMYANIHAINDGCLIGNNHHESPYPGEDIQIFERDLPGENNAGMSGQDISPLPLETCETMNGMWGYKITDQNYKSARQLIHYIVKAAGRNANLLMNIGPQPDGSLPSTSVQRLKEVGEWMSVYGESIYGTRGGRVTPRSWGVTTEKDGKIFVHILDLQDDCLFLPITDIKVKRASYFNSSKMVTFRQDKRGVLLQLDEVPTDTDCVISLDY